MRLSTLYFFLEESISLIDVEPLKFQDNVLLIFKTYNALHEKQSDCQLKVFYKYGRGKYIREFDNYL